MSSPDKINSHTRIKVCHLIHSADYGGVETAVAAIRREPPPELIYKVATIAGSKMPDTPTAIPRLDHTGLGLNNPLSICSVTRWIHRVAPDIVIASLWRAIVAGLVNKVISRKAIFIIFLHNTSYTSLADRLATALGKRFADAVLCDSDATANIASASGNRHLSSHVVPLAPQNNLERHFYYPYPGALHLVFWGRIAQQKRIDRTLDVLQSLVSILGTEKVHFTAIGPDGGSCRALAQRASQLGLAGNITWLGPRSLDRVVESVRCASFFVQLSDYEGMAMAVIEAMSLGLVPVVTPVGQISQYTTDGLNAVHYSDPTRTARRIHDLWSDSATYRCVSDRAVQEWAARPDTGASLAKACVAIMSRSPR